ncbi:hypothetical protein [Ancylomarina sp. 16SWW S1-10-2]|uniref:hypothetical protein n=1 Tax=Ancylomarina sp. 16SWW S1-10-2 TaxID=2499681 RepID=UPI0012ADCCF1|nr:hypothetical protein [Ancylomarina sp. 16SWW S1-10-2]MRT93366.1 hypothetical protein [Ancylomarina sp. 16SWW S1-10-2]
MELSIYNRKASKKKRSQISNSKLADKISARACDRVAINRKMNGRTRDSADGRQGNKVKERTGEFSREN